MKTLFKNILKTTLLAFVLLAGVQSAYATGEFHNDPAGNGYGIASIGDTSAYLDSTNANYADSYSVSVPNPGNTEQFQVYIDYQNKGASTITNTRARMSFSDNSNIIQGILSGSGVGQKASPVFLQNTPSSFDLTLIAAKRIKKNKPSACAPNYNTTINKNSLKSSSGVSLPDLGTLGTSSNGETGHCDQGHVVAVFEIKNTEQPSVAYLYTWEESAWGACNGTIEQRTVWCEQNPGATTVSDSNCSAQGAKPASTRPCQYATTLAVSTNPANVNEPSVTLSGTIQSGSNTNHYFVVGDGSNISCSSVGGHGSDSLFIENSVQTGNSLSTNQSFSFNVANPGYTLLSPGTYRYRACAGSDMSPAQGGIQTFQIVGSTTNPTYNWHTGAWSSPDSNNICYRDVECRNQNGTTVSSSNCPASNQPVSSQSCGSTNSSLPQAQTNNQSSVSSSSAILRGAIQMNTVDNGRVFFVYGQDKSDIEEIPDVFDAYTSINTSSVDKVEVDSNNDTDSWRNYSKSVSSLSTDRRYYYRMCVEYYHNGSDDITCGVVKNFKTDRGNNSSTIVTREVSNISQTSAKICGELLDDGGDNSLRTWMEIRRSTSNSWKSTSKTDRGENKYCETVNGLSSNTKYYYRSCSENRCASTRTFTTGSGVINNQKPYVTTDTAYSITSNSAVLPGTYLPNANRSSVWFRYGRSQNLTNSTTRYTKFGSGGGYTHNFTNLKSNQRYCYQAVIETTGGTDYGSIKCFTTRPAVTNNRPVVVQRPVVIETVVEDDDTDIDLSRLGLGLSLIRLEVNDNFDAVSKGQTVTYDVTWENISDIDLDNLDLNITIPREVQITSFSRGRLDQDRNAIFYTIPNLDAKEENSMTVTGIVTNGNLGDALTAEATIAFANPLNQARENATDYDVDEYVVAIAGVGTASVFGLSNITFLGWLTIILGLLIVFLVARWLYLEREELRAQAYVNGYGRAPQYMAPVDNRYDYIAPAAAQPVQPVREARYVEPVYTAPTAPQQAQTPAPVQTAPTQEIANPNERADYRPYRPNRG
ncbi:MAG: hypothetical protein ACPGTS_00545 [Minisyncoccia bacterium]